MDNSIYEVDRDDYVGFIGQLNKEKCDVEKFYESDVIILKIKSKATGTHFCTRIIPEEGDEHYYIFNMPDTEEMVAPKAIRKITLETKEEVQAFFNALNKVQMEAKHHDGDIC